MTQQRVKQIHNMVNGWNEMDQYEEDLEKTEVIRELLAELCNRPSDIDKAA